jgi:TRAP-type C4-dicarboxylate transport system substrate-binding protein
MVGEAVEFWNELSEAERAEMREAQRKADQEMLLQSEQEWIDTNNSLVETLKGMIGRRVRKEDYTDKDQEIVELALGVIKACERDIKIAEREILLLAKYPVGSKQRPNLILRKEYDK